MVKFLVDANFFIQAHRDNYPFDVAVSFWSKINQLATEGRIFSIDKVKAEIYDKNDLLEEWCKANLPEEFFEDSSDSIAAYSKISTWAISKKSHYKETAINEFLDADEADAFILAHALSNKEKTVIVTHEKSQPDIKRKIKIPEVANHFGLKYLNTVEMFREMNESF